ncbi:MAG: hypothetical protein IJW93_06800 [Clostridia bacterium]|nr:hypothetical protein [Clostridia bacterium]
MANHALNKVALQNLVARANAKTSKNDGTITDAIASLEAGYGQGGSFECSGEHVIQVEKLPTENIDETALYKKGDIYYQWTKELKDIIQVQSNGSLLSMKELYEAWGIATCEFYYVKTRPTENIHAVDQTASPMTLPFYYVEDEDDVLVYGDFNETGTNEWVAGVVEDDSQTWEGAITDESEATVVNGTYALVSDGWKEYLAPRGSVTITENKTVDVTSYTSAIVNIPAKPQSYMVQTADELPTDAPYGSTAVVLGGVSK